MSTDPERRMLGSAECDVRGGGCEDLARLLPVEAPAEFGGCGASSRAEAPAAGVDPRALRAPNGSAPNGTDCRGNAPTLFGGFEEPCEGEGPADGGREGGRDEAMISFASLASASREPSFFERLLAAPSLGGRAFSALGLLSRAGVFACI